jgi:ATP-dependent DNA helicase RecG
MKNLNDLIALGEGFTTEFKRSGTGHLGRELCAFANATGGTVLIGVADDGSIVGISDANRLKSEVQNIARSIDPPLVVDVELQDNVLVVAVPPQNSKPYSAAGKFYFRDGATSQQMSRDEIREYFFKEGLIRFDEMPCDRFDLKTDLTDSVCRRFAQQAGLPAGADFFQTLGNLHLVKDGKMTNAGAWLLTDDIRKASSSAHVSCALFLGHTKTRILDRKDFDADVYSNYQDTVTWVLSKLNTEFIIETMQREERPELPEAALREAVVNALAHRDYRSAANVQIYIFEDRLEIVSPGGLPAGMTPELLGIKSIPRNPLLFGMLYRMDAVEQVGSGVRRIREICRDYGVAEPEYEISEHWVTMTFQRPKLVNGVRVEEEVSEQLGNRLGNTKVSSEANEEKAGGPMGGLIGGPMGGSIELTTRQAQLLDMIHNSPKLSKNALAEKLGINPSAVQKHLEVLKKKGVLRRIGGTRGHWEVLQ